MRSRRVARTTAAVLTTVLLGTASLTGCASAPTIAPGEVESELVRGLAEQVGGTFSATCPSPIPAQAGQVTACTVTDETGDAAVEVEVVQTDTNGTFRWRVTSVGPPAGSLTPSDSGS